jgi:serine/threonine protein phosphatase PrpC
MSATNPNDTVEIPAAPSAGADVTRSLSASARVEMAGLSHPGKVRPNNEDHFLVGRFGRYLETLQSNLPEGEVPPLVEETGYGMLVADGVGGSAAGGLASQLAIRTIVDLFLQTPDWILRLEQVPLVEKVMQRAAERYEKVNQALAELAEDDPELRGLATTLTIAASLGRCLIVAHVGDSRAYLLRGGKLSLLTRDHTLAQSMAQLGFIKQDQVATHHLRHVLLKALGGQDRRVEPDVHEHVLDDGDCLLICTDGLTEMVDEKTIRDVLGSGDTSHEVCQRLIDLALKAGGKDNVTVVCARYRFAQ